VKRLTLRHKLYLTVVPLTLMGAVISFITWRSLRENATPLIQAQQLRGLARSSLSLLFTQDDAIKTMMLDPDNSTSNMRKIKAYDENQKVLGQIGKLRPYPGVRETIRAMSDLDANVLRDIDTRVLEAVGDGKTDKARELYFRTYEPQRAKYEAYVRKLVQIADQQSKQAETQLSQSNATSIRNIIGALVIGVFIIALCLAYLARSVTAKMNSVVSCLTRDYEAAKNSMNVIREASRRLSDGVSSTSAAIQEIDSAVCDFGSRLHATGDHAAFARQCSAKAVSNADNASQAIRELVEATNEAQKSSNQIISIIKVIDEISFKTNMLALNAAVEAARAGEAGLGFSVVAEEVRNLARSSADAAQQTAELIQTSVAKTKQGYEMSERAARALTETISESHRIHGVIDEIASNSRSQNDNLKQITASLSHIGNIGQKSARDAEQTHGIAETLRERSQHMEEVTGDLVSLIGSPAGA
jgi:methyl-accepting chemotaxis protein